MNLGTCKTNYLALFAYNKADIGLDLMASVNIVTASSKFPEIKQNTL